MEKITPQYDKAVQLIKQAILHNQLEATKAVNRQMLALYYGVGKYVSENTRHGAWGTGAIDSISQQLQREMPGLRGFSASNIKKMRLFYEEWANVINRSPLANDLQPIDSESILPMTALLDINRPPLANDLDWHEFLSLSFSHHYEILSKAKTIEERAFYIHQSVSLH